MRRLILLLLAVLCLSCNQPKADKSKTENPHTDAPEWAQGVIWYQIMVERFRNGDPANDPTVQDITRGNPPAYLANWATTPWTQEWYKPDAYFSDLHGQQAFGGFTIEKHHQKAQFRRYGGDLQGVWDKIDYLDSLGITAIYFNPLNDAPSLHKYDPTHWRHIDRNFGPSPAADVKMMAQETPDDPATWQMTGADQLFVNIIHELHKRGIRVIMDYSWNHTGNTFWAMDDIRAKGEKSKYVDWFTVHKFDDPQTTEDEFDYQGWIGIKTLPEIKETVEHDPAIVKAYEGNLHAEAVKQHIFNISKRWLDPNGDGDPSDGVDGFRLDVAAELPLGFWREYRTYVRDIQPEAYLLGEVWWEKWPDKLLDPAPFLKGDVFDAVMNYRWYRAARHFFNDSPNEITVSEFTDSLMRFSSNLRQQNTYAMMNLVASHDVPRVATSLFNKNKYKYQTNASIDNPYKIHKPDADTRETLKLLLAQQFTYVGAPHIWAGDEMGMWGGDDPNCRKPLIWPDMTFEAEKSHPLGMKRPIDQVAFDKGLFDYYQKLISIRKANPLLIHGGLNFWKLPKKDKLLLYSRSNDTSAIFVVFNAYHVGVELNLNLPLMEDESYTDLLSGKKINPKRGFTIEPRTAMILSLPTN